MKRIITTIAIVTLILSGNLLLAQTNNPVAVNDTVAPVFGMPASGQADTTVIINVVENDYDPNGDPIRIYEIKNRIGQENVDIEFTENTIVLTMQKMFIVEQVYDYRICKIDDTTSLSNWGYVNVNPCWSEDYAVARNDTVIAMRGSHISINVLRNDYHPLGDSMIIQLGPNVQDSTINVGPYYYVDEDFLHYDYYVSDTTALLVNADMGRVYIKLLNSEWYDSLDINNINARFNCNGMQFWDLDEINHFKVPNGSEITSIFSQSLWIGGLDESENLHLAGEMYRWNGSDYWQGPVSDVYDSIYDQRWLHVWKLNRDEIEYHKAHWWETEYEPISDILSWPGNGDVELGQSEFIAPFEDINENSVYEPLLGDAPIIRGDQALFFVYNDDRYEHGDSEGIPLGVEIRTMAYAFDHPEDSALWNTIFIHYDIVNQSDTAYHEMYMGVFTDTDLGNPSDDRIECDVKNGMYFTYNGTENDASTNWINGYGEHPPAQGIQILAGPNLEDDGIDNPKFDELGQQIVNESINGLNFGDGVIDNERLGMTGFMYFNGGNGIWSYPDGSDQFYTYLQSRWRDGSNLLYGGYGFENYAVGPECKFMWPRDSDPYNWGTFGLIPNGGLNQNGLYWSEEQVGANPDDRKGLGSVGPFLLAPGQTQSLDLALPWARDYNGTAWSSAELLKERAAYIKELFQNDPDFFSRVERKQFTKQNISVYPNPAINEVKIRLPDSGNNNLTIYSLIGLKQMEISLNGKKNELKLDCSKLPTGIYIIQVRSDKKIYSSKFIKN